VYSHDNEPLLKLLLLERRLVVRGWVVRLGHLIVSYPRVRVGKRIDYAGLR